MSGWPVHRAVSATSWSGRASAVTIGADTITMNCTCPYRTPGQYLGKLWLENAELVAPGVAENPEIVAALLLVVVAVGADRFEALDFRLDIVGFEVQVHPVLGDLLVAGALERDLVARGRAAGVIVVAATHPERPAGWVIAWGDPDAGGLDIRPLRFPGERTIDRTAVAGYLDKYATKSTEDTGHLSKRLRADTVDYYADDSHPGRLVEACWTLGTPEAGPDWERMRRWAHQLGYGGHFFTKSRRYTATFHVVRAARRTWVRRQADLDTEATNATEVVITSWSFVGIGWQTTGDALLAQTSAAVARERRRIAREEAVSA